MNHYIRPPYPNELYHHGIKGQKWGVRRYQNPDGTLTKAGKEHYGGPIKDASNQAEINRQGAYRKMVENPDKYYDPELVEIDKDYGPVIKTTFSGHGNPSAVLDVYMSDTPYRNDGKPFSKNEASKYLKDIDNFIKNYNKIDEEIRQYIADHYYDEITKSSGVTKKQFKDSLELWEGHTLKDAYSLSSIAGKTSEEIKSISRCNLATISYRPSNLPEETGWYEWWFNSEYDMTNNNFKGAWLH